MTTSRKDVQEQFHKAALDAYQRHGFKSYRDAEQKTGVNYSTIYMIVSRGRIPTRGQVIEWAEGIKEPINHWLELAGYDPISSTLVNNGSSDPVKRVQFALNGIPFLEDYQAERIRELIEKHTKKEDK